jgi:hypothetical protein
MQLAYVFVTYTQGGNSRLEVQKVRQSTKELQSGSKYLKVAQSIEKYFKLR